MKISYNWLKQFVKIDWDAIKTGELLTDLGLEIEGIADFESVKGGLEGVVVGHVLTCEKHPNADKLKLTTVDIGASEPVQIVCGAPNVAQGQKVPVATIGTKLYTNDGESWTIKKGKIRGEESQGMICAEDEIGLGDGHEGILVLSDDLSPGTSCAEVFDIENDKVFEIGLTPNRADAMSHFGVARDLKAGLSQKDINIELITPSISNFNVDNRSFRIDVDVQNTTLAPRYCGITIANIIVQPSPDWLKNRLRAIGLSPINNVVDATNYVLHELGQPLHAFDATKIKGNKVVVQTLPTGTKFVTLDGEERTLHEEDLMICDEEKPMCIAGVFGGQHSGVTEHTTAIFLESAYFDPVSIRKTAKRHVLNTDASFRFERGIDINNTEYALQRAALLIKEITGGNFTSDVVDIYPKKMEDYEVFLNFERVNQLIGQEIPRDTIKAILSSLEIKVQNVTETGMGLLVPFYRVDVQREVDVIEEILRVFGYNAINFSEKLNASVVTTTRFEDYKLQNIIGNLLIPQGFYEIMTNSFIPNEYHSFLEETAEEKTVKMLNPLSHDLAVMRQSMLFSGLDAIAHNVNRRQKNLKFFEFGKTYQTTETGHTEFKHLNFWIIGNRNIDSWTIPSQKSDFYFLKTVVENVLTRLGISTTSTVVDNESLFLEGITFKKGDAELVSFGIVKQAITEKFDLKEQVLFADFKWDTILKLAKKHKIMYQEIPRYPEVRRDFALLIDNAVSFQQIKDIAFSVERKLLKQVSLFDVYTGKNLPEGKKSYAVSFTLQNDKNTLTDKVIDKVMKKLQQQYESQLNAVLR